VSGPLSRTEALFSCRMHGSMDCINDVVVELYAMLAERPRIVANLASWTTTVGILR